MFFFVRLCVSIPIIQLILKNFNSIFIKYDIIEQNHAFLRGAKMHEKHTW